MKGKHNPKIDSSKKTKLLTVGFRYHRRKQRQNASKDQNYDQKLGEG